jgi:hypothetical protein
MPALTADTIANQLRWSRQAVDRRQQLGESTQGNG